MSILINEKTTVLVQGITGRIGRIQTADMLGAGSKIAAGVTPGKGGETVEGLPVYDTVAEALKNHTITASILFVPPGVAEDSCIEAMAAGVKILVVITEHLPVHDTLRIRAWAERYGTTVVGPNTAGLISPGKCKMGIMPTSLFSPGPVGLISRSGTLSYEIGGRLTALGIGQSTVVGMGADPVVGTDLVRYLELFEEDPETKAVVLVGEVGGSQEERAAEFIRTMTKPVVAYIAGRTAPEGVRMGHAGAIVSRGMGSVEGKIKALEAVGARIVESPGEVPPLIKEVLSDRR
jgi:succinyl-CoA synthetase alpha subunit